MRRATSKHSSRPKTKITAGAVKKADPRAPATTLHVDQLDVGTLSADVIKAKRTEAERIEAERIEAERIKADQIKANKIEVKDEDIFRR